MINDNKRLTYQRMTEMLKALSEEYDFLKLSSLGNTFRGRSIPLVSIGSGERSCLYVAAHHGAEGITSSVIMRFLFDISSLIKRGMPVSGVDAEYFMQSRRLYIVPMLNPDGVEISTIGVKADDIMYERLKRANKSDDFTLWQANGRGVDLNHNYDDGFKTYKKLELRYASQSGGRSKYSGEYPESEPETKALAGFIRKISPKWILTLHSQGREIYYKSGRSLEREEENERLERTVMLSKKNAETASRLTGYKISQPSGSAAYGGLLDWAINKMYIPTLTLECGMGKNPLPETDLPLIYTELRELLLSAPMVFVG